MRLPARLSRAPHAPSAAPPPPLDTARAAARINRALFFVGVIFTFAGLKFFLDPASLDRAAVGRALPGIWDEAWSLCYIVGGFAICAGIFLSRGKSPGAIARGATFELPGVTLVGVATLTNALAVIMVGGTRGVVQVPVYALALWVLDGRRRDLRELPSERRHGKPDARPIVERIDRRLHATAAPPAVAMIVGAGAITVDQLLPAILGGGIVTALVQVVMYRPQRRDLEVRLAATATQSAATMLDEHRKDLADAKRQLERAHAQIDDLRERETALERRCERAEDRVHELERRLADLESAS